jgi:hypothetical protein
MRHRPAGTVVRITAGLVLLGVVAGCGGGGSGSTGSSVAGTYRGTASLTVTTGPASVTEHVPIVVVVSPDNAVSIEGVPQTAPLSGNAFSIVVPAAALAGPGVDCTGGSASIDGTISGTTMAGTISSSQLVCNGLPATVTGTFTATLQAQVPAGAARGDLAGALRALIRSLGAR